MARCYYMGIIEGILTHCKEEGIYGLPPRTGDPVYAHSEWIRKARYCRLHKHYDDKLMKDADEKVLRGGLDKDKQKKGQQKP